MKRISLFPCLFALVWITFDGAAQDPPEHVPTVAPSDEAVLLPEHFRFHEGVELDPAIPSPEQFLGYAPGEAFTLHAHVIDYVRALAEASDRIVLRGYGRTYEDRPLVVLFVTSPENHGRLERIRADNLRLADPSLPESERRPIIDSNPVVTWLSYNVHGNEASSTEAAMQVLYRLAAATDDETAELLDRSVVVIDPAINPDGRDRYAYWYRSVRSHRLRTDAAELEHDEPWPGGRTNHYWFDLNRDWVWLVHPESASRIAAYREWLPQVHLDYHEQSFNSNYFTVPGQEPRNLNLPAEYEEWADTFGRGHAAAFDRAGVNYHTRESFDFFYPGYGSSYPSTMGAIGMLAEQGGHSRGGRAVETEDGYVLTLRQRIFDHYTTSLETIRTAVAHRAELLEYFARFFTQEENSVDTRAYFLADDGGTGYTSDVISILLAHDVRVERLTADTDLDRAFDYWTGAASSRTMPAGTYVVSTDQPRHVFVNTILQRQMVIEDSVMYDMATWSAPLAYNLEAWWTSEEQDLSVEAVDAAPAVAGRVDGPAEPYAYVIDWSQRHAPRALSMLWDAGYRVRSVEKAFALGEDAFGRGTLVVLRGRNRERADRMADDMQRIAREAGVRITGLPTGRMDEGIDLASDSAHPVDEPAVALIAGPGFSSYTAGQLWFLFDRWTGFGIDRIRPETYDDLDLSDYDVLLLPGGNPGSIMDSTDVEALGNWVRAGGTLVATESSADFFTAAESGLTAAELVEDPEEDEEEDDAAPEVEEAFYTRHEARADSSGLERIPGSAMRGFLDDSHPLAFGIGERVYSLKFGTSALMPSESLETVGFYDRDPESILASGYASRRNRQKLAGNAFAAVERMGSGHVVFLLDNTQYRMFWVGPARLVQNAVMLMPGM